MNLLQDSKIGKKNSFGQKYFKEVCVTTKIFHICFHKSKFYFFYTINSVTKILN